MEKFNNQAYESLLNDLMHGAFYADNNNRIKISSIRSCAEVVIRRILGILPKDRMTLGCKTVQDKVNEINNPFLSKALEIIRQIGNDATHTQDLSEKTEDDVKQVVNALFDLYAYLFIQFFIKYSFGSTPRILTQFSLLPPIIRYKALTELHTQDPENLDIIDKLALATLKAKHEEDAIEWVNSNADRFNADMYNSLIEKIKLVSKAQNKPVYLDFESALPHYKNHGKLIENTQENIEFNSIMEFVYLGRKESPAIK